MLNPPHLLQIPARFFLSCDYMVLRIKRLSKATPDSDTAPVSDRGASAVSSRGTNCKCGVSLMHLMGLVLVSVMVISVVFSLSVMLRDPPVDALWARNRDFQPRKAIPQQEELAQGDHVPKIPLGDLLPTGFDKKACHSRFESVLYHQGISKKASPHLISRLRSYEALHKKCGPYTDSYNKTVEDLKFGGHSSISDCEYIVWISYSGLGNRILSLASTFLYALLTNRVLLVDRGVDIPELFCEPFPESSWLLPLDFPLANQMKSFNKKSNDSFGNMLKSNSIGNSPRSHMYVHLVNDYDHPDKLFFCDQDKTYLHNIPWLIMKSDNYFIPYLFLIPHFGQELHNLFPDKESVFHLLGRYLLHPTNSVWGLVTRYYHAYLSKADVKVGIQIRVFDTEPGPFKHVMDQILSCITTEKILPQIIQDETIITPSRNQKTVAVLMTSLSPGYYEEVRKMYWENPTVTGEVVAVYQPSYEGYQQTEKHDHNKKAWAEMYLLSLMDKLVTSSWSTFGYVAQGLGGVKPWILHRPKDRVTPNPACGWAMSMEPCFHAPPYYDCKLRRGADSGAMVPYVKNCEDVSWGIKLVEAHSEF